MASLADVLRQTGYAQDGTLATPTPVESPMTKVLAEHIKSLPQKFNENQAHQMSLINQAFPGNTYESMMTQGDPKAMAELAMQTPFNAMIAYHGTPHKILGGFDISKVGTGEGAQAYGHGMYFAEAKPVAQQYATDRSYVGKFMTGTPDTTPWDAKRIAQDTLNVHGEDAIAQLEKTLKNNSYSKNPKQLEANKQVQEAIDLLKTNELKPTGNLYKVDIPDEHIPNMLDWDKPLNKQSAKVLEIAKQLDPNLLADTPHLIVRGQPKHWTEVVDKLEDLQNPKVIKLLKKIYGEGAEVMPYGDYLASTMTGEQLYRNLSNPTQWAKEAAPYAMKAGMEDAAVSAKLNELGIPGIRYKDAMSRGADEGTSNFVVFDPSTVKILEENSKPVSRKALIEEQVNKLKD